VRLVADVTGGSSEVRRIVLEESGSGVFLYFYGPRESIPCAGEE
jgi:hypothetical protein